MQFNGDKTWEPLKTRSLNFCHLNVNKILKLRNLDNTNYIRPALLGITESKLDGFVMNAEINNGYSIIRNDRNRNGGGVACYIRKNLFFSNSTEHVFSRNSHSRSSHTIFKILIPFSIFFLFAHQLIC